MVTTTDAEGNFNFQSLAPGRYKVTVEVAGFTEGGGELHLADGTTTEFADHHEGWLGERIGHSLYRGPGG